MSFGIDTRKLKKLIDLYRPGNQAEEMKYLLILKGEDDLFINLQTCPFQGISENSIQDRRNIFGRNQLKKQKQSPLMPLRHSLSLSYVKFSILMSVLCWLLQLCGVGTGSMLTMTIILGISIINWVIHSLRRVWFDLRVDKMPHQLPQRAVTAIRQNRKESLSSSELVVGDVIEIKEGDTVPADGWLIEGKDIIVQEPHITNANIQTKKNVFRDCLAALKEQLSQNESKISSETSPVLIGGSQVMEGEGRMLVLCVGHLSRQGVVLEHSQLKYRPNFTLTRLQQLAQHIYKHFFYLVILYFILFALKLATSSLTNPSWFDGSLDQLLVVPWMFILGLPQGLHLGLLLGFWLLKGRAYLTDSIWVDYCEDITKMAHVNMVCLDQSLEKGKTVYREWWNEQNHRFYKQALQQKEERELQPLDDLNDIFRGYFEKASIFRECKQPNQYYMNVGTPMMTRQFGQEQTVSIFSEQIKKRHVYYLCVGDSIRYVVSTYSKQKQTVCLVLGYSEDVIKASDAILSKSTGEVYQFNENVVQQITDITNSMNRRIMSSLGVAYCELQASVQAEDQLNQVLSLIESEQLTFLCLLGASGIKQHSEYQLTTKLKQNGINIMFVSSSNLPETALRSKHMGVNAAEEETLALTGEQFVQLVGDIQCAQCKKNICQCPIKPYQPKIKNLQQLRHIQRGFRVLAEANSAHKYALLVGLQNTDNQVAYLGQGAEDKPALAQAYLSISVSPDLEGYSVSLPKNDIKTLSRLVIWSKLSQEFAQKYLQLIIPASLVSIIITILGSLLSKQIVIDIIPLTWLCAGLCPALAIGLAWDNLQEKNLLSQEKQQAKLQVLSGSVKKQIVGQTIWQLFVLLIVMLTGHLYIPESNDAVDSTIGTAWQVKYSNQQKSLVCNGLYQNPLLNTSSYQSTYVKYSIQSRHMTFVYNILALMTLLNYFNCRKTKDHMINIVEGLSLPTFIVFAFVFCFHFVFMNFTGQKAGFYPYSLTAAQWLLSLGIALSVWLITFLVKLLPTSPGPGNLNSHWVNRSVNLGIKLVNNHPALAEFELEEQIQLKML